MPGSDPFFLWVKAALVPEFIKVHSEEEVQYIDSTISFHQLRKFIVTVRHEAVVEFNDLRLYKNRLQKPWKCWLDEPTKPVSNNIDPQSHVDPQNR